MFSCWEGLLMFEDWTWMAVQSYILSLSLSPTHVYRPNKLLHWINRPWGQQAGRMLVWGWLSALSEPLPLTSEVVSRSRGQLTVLPTRLSCSRGPWCGIIWEAPWRRRVPESTWGRHTALHFRPVTPTPGVCGTLPPVLQSSHASSLTDRPVRVYHSASQQPLFSQIFCRQAVTASHWAPDKELVKCLIVKSINTPRLPRIVAHTSFGKEK